MEVQLSLFVKVLIKTNIIICKKKGHSSGEGLAIVNELFNFLEVDVAIYCDY